MKEPCHTYEWAMSHIWIVTSHIWMSHVTQMNESHHMYEWATSHMWMSHVTHMNEACHTYEWVMSHIWMRHVTHMNESCHNGVPWVMSQLIVCVMSHIWMSHVTHMNEPCHTYEWAMSHIWMIHVIYMNEPITLMNESSHEGVPCVMSQFIVAEPMGYVTMNERAQFGTWKGAVWLSTRVCCNWVTLHVISRCTYRKTLCTHGKTTDNKTVCTHKKKTDRKTLYTHRKTTPSTDRKTWSTHIDESYDVYGWVMSHTSHITIKWYMESCSIWLWVLVFGQWVMLHISIRHMIESLDTYDSFSLTHMEVTHSYAWLICATWLAVTHTTHPVSHI